jgi:virulence-associated protein VapD
MTYITAHLPKLEELKKRLEKNPDDIKIYMKYMGFEGPAGSIDYLTEKIEEYINSKKRTQ